MALIDGRDSARELLAKARQGDSDLILEGLGGSRIVGVVGEGEVGKTATVRRALHSTARSQPVIEVDLAGVAGEEQLGFQLSRGIAVSILGAGALAALSDAAAVPSELQGQRIELAETIGVDGLNEALRPWPSGAYPLARAWRGLEEFARDREVVLWVDHIEAPTLTPRHPLDTERLLWALREMTQRLPRLHLVLSAREAFRPNLLGPKAPFHQQGQWLNLDNPPLITWQNVAVGLGVGDIAARELFDFTGGHSQAMLLGLVRLVDRNEKGFEALRALAQDSIAVTERALQHAQTLHRLGGQVFEQIAFGQGPYAMEQRGGSPAQEIFRVLHRLQLAGLVRHNQDGWEVVDPLIRIALTESVRGAAATESEAGA